jgi:hypothetical protein
MIEAMRQPAPPPPVASWLRAIDIRTRLDWRVLPAPATATLLERLQHTRALDARLDGDDAVAFVASHDAEPVADWSRILLQIGFSVEAGNAYADDAIALEVAEAVAVHAIVRGRPPAPGALVEALNQPPTRGRGRPARGRGRGLAVGRRPATSPCAADRVRICVRAGRQAGGGG